MQGWRRLAGELGYILGGFGALGPCKGRGGRAAISHGHQRTVGGDVSIAGLEEARRYAGWDTYPGGGRHRALYAIMTGLCTTDFASR